MIYGYARISTATRDETGQVRQLKAAGCEKVFRKKITGTTADRPQLRARPRLRYRACRDTERSRPPTSSALQILAVLLNAENRA